MVDVVFTWKVRNFIGNQLTSRVNMSENNLIEESFFIFENFLSYNFL